MVEMSATGLPRPGRTERVTPSIFYSLEPFSSQLSHHGDSLGILQWGLRRGLPLAGPHLPAVGWLTPLQLLTTGPTQHTPCNLSSTDLLRNSWPIDNHGRQLLFTLVLNYMLCGNLLYSNR